MKACAKIQPEKEPTKQLAIRMREELHDELTRLMADSKSFNSKPEFITFSMKDKYLRTASSENDLNDGATVKKLSGDIRNKKLLFDNKDGDTVQITIHIQNSFYERIRLLSALLGVSTQDFIKASVMEEMDRVSGSILNISLTT